MDSLDLAIAKILTEDARTSFRKIAEELGVSPDTVINRYNKLRDEGVIRGSTVVIAPKELGYQGMAVFLIDVTPSHIIADEASVDSSLILGKIIRMRNIILATKTVGDHDLLALGVIKDLKHLIEVSGDIAKIPGVKDVESSFWTGKTQICPKYFIV